MRTSLPELDNLSVFTEANSIWAKKGLTFRNEYIAINKTYYDAETKENLSFDNNTVKEINEWCNKKTKGLIPDFLNDIPDDLVSLILNALYFKGTWESPFDTNATNDKPFYLADGSHQTVHMMHQDIETDAMRNRQLIAKWVYEKGKADKVIELKKRDNKTFVVINDYQKLRSLFGSLLAEVQRIKSEGDYAAGKRLVEDYGVKVDQTLHAEVLARYAKLHLAPYKGFVNPVMKEVKNKEGKVTDVVLDYSESYVDQMMRYSHDYSFLPSYNE